MAIVACAALGPGHASALGADFTVTTTADSGVGSLRQAILDANASPGADSILFAIPGTVTHTITPATALDPVTEAVTIDATTDDSFGPNLGRPAVVLDGEGLAGDGLVLAGGFGGSVVRGLVIRDFGSAGLRIQAAAGGNQVVGNYLGGLDTSAGDAGAAEANGDEGLAVASAGNTIGGPGADANVISRNGQSGIVLHGGSATANTIRGNRIGTDAAGTALIGNGQSGVAIYGGANANVVGGTAASAANVIVGSGTDGVTLADPGGDLNRIEGNLIGIAADGVTVLGNTNQGVWLGAGVKGNVVGGTAPGAGNVIGGSTYGGVELNGPGTSGNTVAGNAIGTDAAGLLGFANGSGVVIAAGASGNTIGGTSLAAANRIAHNTGDGVVVMGTSTGNAIVGNSTSENGGLAIDLGNDGITVDDPGDGDTGPNDLLNAPVLTTATTSANGTVVVGSYDGLATTTLRLEFFTNRPALADPSTAGETQRFLGATTVTTDGGGHAGFAVTLPRAFANHGDQVTATATQADAGLGSTSEAAANITATASGVVVVETTADTAGGTTTSIADLGGARGPDGAISLREAIEATESTPNGGTPDLIAFGIATGTGTRSIAVTGSQLPPIADAATIDGTTQSGYVTGTPAVAIDGSAAGVDATGLILRASDSTVKGLEIRDFAQGTSSTTGVGILVDGAGGAADGVTIADNLLVGNGEPVSGAVGAISVAGAADDLLIDGNALTDNDADGIRFADGLSTGATITDNTITRQGDDGVKLVGADITFSGNTVHTTQRLTPTAAGVEVAGATGATVVSGNTITAAGLEGGIWILGTSGAVISGNTITGGLGDGIRVDAVSVGNVLSQNAISGNAGLGIDLLAALAPVSGVSPNDAGDPDAGGNDLQNLPVLTLVRTDAAGQLEVTGSLDSAPGAPYRIELFASATQDPSGYGEAQRFLGSIDVTTDGSGVAAIFGPVAATVAVGERITATATESVPGFGAFGDTSELSRAVAAIALTGPTVTVDTVADTLDGDTTSLSTLIADRGADARISLREAILAANATVNAGGPDHIAFDVPDALVGGAHTIVPATPLPPIDRPVIIDASTEPDAILAGRPVIELDGSGLGGNPIGLQLVSGAAGSTVRGLTIGRFHVGVELGFGAGSSTVAGNRIGTDVTGELDRGNANSGIHVLGDGNTIGGPAPADANVISGNDGYGIYVSNAFTGGSANRIVGNLIGLDDDGAQALGNTFNGLYVSGSDNVIGAPGEGNVISANGDIGVRLEGAIDTVIQSNRIGTDASGAVALGNLVGVGLDFGTTGTTVGGTGASEGNTISGNLGDGITVGASGTSARNAILGNLFEGNSDLAVDLGGDGVTANDPDDPDTGDNDLQNRPVLTAVSSSAGSVKVDGALDSLPSTTFRIEVYSSAGPGPGGDVEAERFLGAFPVTTDANGDAVIHQTIPAVSATIGHRATATATRISAAVPVETSELSAPVGIVSDPLPTAVVGGPYALPEGGSLALDASASSDPDGDALTYAWDVDGDGVFGEPGEPTAATTVLPWASLQALGIDDDGVTAVSVRVTDPFGGTDVGTTSLTVTNVRPALSVSGPASVSAGSPVTLTLSAVDPGADTITAWSVNWGDGSVQTVAGNPPTVAHTYTRGGLTFGVTIAAVDEDGTHLGADLLVPSWSGTDTVFRVGPGGSPIAQFAGGDGLDDQAQVIAGPDGNLYVSGLASGNILRYTTAGAFVDVFVAAGSGGLVGPAGMAFGPDGNLYVVDMSTAAVRRYAGSTGAPLGTFVTPGSGGLASPLGVVFGPDNDLYVGSRSPDAVLRYDGSTGAFVEVLVDPGPHSPSGAEMIAFGPDGNLYVANNNDDTVRRYDGGTGAWIDDFVAAGSGGLDGPAGIAFGPDGALYVASQAVDAIERYDGATGAPIGDYVASGAGGLDSPAYLLFQPMHQVAVTAVNAAPTADAGGPLTIAEGEALALDGTGSADPDPGDTLAYAWDVDGDGVFGEPGEPTTATPSVNWGTLGSLGIADDGSFTVGLRVTDGSGATDVDTATLTVRNTSPTLTATGAATVAAGQPFVLTLGAADPGADTISGWTVVWGDGSVQTVVGSPPSVAHTYGAASASYPIAVSATDEDGTHAAGSTLVADMTADGVLRLDATTGALRETLPANPALVDPDGMTFGPDGRLYVAGGASDDVVWFDLDAHTTGTFVAPGSGGLDGPGGLAFGRDGNLYVASYENDRVLRYDGATGAFVDVVASTGLDGPDTLAIGADGDLYVGTWFGGIVRRYDLPSGTPVGGVFATSPAGFGISAIGFGRNGDLYVGDGPNSGYGLMRFDGTTGAFVSTVDTSGHPSAVVTGPDGALYVPDFVAPSRVRRYDTATGAVISFVDDGATGLALARGLAVEPAHVLEVTPVNAQPTAADGAATTNEGGPPLSVDLRPLVADAETADADLTYDIVSGPGVDGTLAPTATPGVLDFTPAVGFDGVATFTYAVTDRGGPDGCGTASAVCAAARTSATRTFSVTVSAANDVPTASDGSVGAAEDAGPVSVDLRPLVADTETGDADLSYAIVSGPAPAFGTLTPTATNGVYAFAPAGDANGDATVTFSVTDRGAPDACGAPGPGCGAPLTSTTATVTIAIAPVNDNPASSAGSATIAEDAPTLTVDLRPLVADVETADANLVFDIVSGPAGASGTLTATATNGVYSFDGAADFNGVASFTFDATDRGDPDGCGAPGPACDAPATSPTQTFQITVGPANDRPTASASPASLGLLEDAGAATVQIGGADVETAAAALVVTVTQAPARGTLRHGATVLTAGSTFTGVPSDVTFTPSPDANGADQFAVTVADTGDGASPALASLELVVPVTITAVNDAPAFTPGTDVAVAEDDPAQVLSGWASGISAGPVDEAGQSLAFQVSNDAPTLFAVQPAIGPTGQLTFTPSPDANGQAIVTVRLVDGGGTADGGADSTAVTTFAITIAPVNDVPSAADGTDTFAEDAATALVDLRPLVADAETADVDLAFAIVAPPAPAAGTLAPTATNGVFALSLTPDFFGAAAFTFSATDRGDPDGCGAPPATCDAAHTSVVRTVSLTILAVDDPPVITSGGGGPTASVVIVEGATGAADVDASDVEGDPTTFALNGGADAGRFAIDPLTGVLTLTAAPDFEAPADANGDNAYDVVVEASDGTLVDSQAIRVTVTDAAESPAITSLGGGASAAVSVAEPATAVTDVDAVDPDAGAVLTYGISGVDAGLFAIDSVTGALTFLVAPDFEAPADANGDNVYLVTASVTDGVTSDTQALTITVTDSPENVAPVITSDGGGPSASLTVPENTIAVTDAAATDANPGDTLTFSVTGADAARFTVDPASGVVAFATAPDFESPADANGDGIYLVTLVVGDGALTDTQALAVTVADVAEGAPNQPPVIGGGPTATVDVPEGRRQVTRIDATDPDGGPLSLTIAGGADAALLTIDPATGDLAFVIATDHEAPADAGRDGTYEVVVRAFDGLLAVQQALAVRVLDVNEAPLLRLPDGVEGDEDTAIPLGTGSVADPEDDGVRLTVTVDSGTVALPRRAGLTVVSGEPSGARALVVEGSPGAVSEALAGLVVTPAPEASGVITLSVVARDGRDGELRVEATVPVVVRPVNDPPRLEPIPVTEVAPGATARFGAVATDPDGPTLSFRLGGAPDGAAINPSSGLFAWTPGADREPGDVGFDVLVSDGGEPERTDRAGATVRVVADGADGGSTPPGGDPTVPGDPDAPGGPGAPPGAPDDPSTPGSGVVEPGDDGSVPDPGTPGMPGMPGGGPGGPAGAGPGDGAVPIGPAPVPAALLQARDDRADGSTGSPVVVDVLANDIFPPAGPQTIVLGVVAHGRARVLPDRTVEYVSEPRFDGVERFTYTLVGPDGSRSNGLVEISVALPRQLAAAYVSQPLLDAPVAIVVEQPAVRGITQRFRAFTQALVDTLRSLDTPVQLLGVAGAWTMLFGGWVLVFRRRRAFVIVGVPRGAALDVLDRPGGTPVYRMRYDAAPVWSRGRRRREGGRTWLPVQTPAGRGYVDRTHLLPVDEVVDPRALARRRP